MHLFKLIILRCMLLDINTCDMDPCTNGDCEDLANGYVCRCHEGYQGMYCEAGKERVISLMLIKNT